MSGTARARTSAEMNFYATLHTCPQCATQVDPAWLKLYGDGTAWSLAGKCGRCQNNLAYTFLSVDEDPINAPRELRELGRGHSELIPPRTFAAEVARLQPTLVTDPTQFGLKDWRQHRDRSGRFQTCVAELRKFFADGANGIADSLLATEDIADRDSNPERYTRAWVEHAAAHAKAVSAGIVSDLPRIDKLEKTAAAKRPKGIDFIEREPLEAHERWVERGKKGKGQLVVVDARHEGMNIGRGVELSGARFYETELPDVYLMDAKLHGAELVDTSLVRGKLYGAELVGATVTGGSFAAADLETADLSRATIEGTDFTGAELHETTWNGATVTRANFTRAEFGDANLDGATFRDCDFKTAVLAADDPEGDHRPSTKARFERCDFTGATWNGRDFTGAVFVDCKGAPT